MKHRILTCLIFAIIGCSAPLFAQERFSDAEKLSVVPDELLGGPRINYMQGKDGFIGAAFHLGWHETDYLPIKHFGFAVGSDFRLSKNLLMAPKISLEYGYYFGVIRVGYLCYTDFGRKLDNRLSAEIGLSLLSFVDLTYVHTFGFNNNPFNLGNDYFNLTISLPLVNSSL